MQVESKVWAGADHDDFLIGSLEVTASKPITAGKVWSN